MNRFSVFTNRRSALRRQHDALNHGDFAVITTDDEQRVIVTSRKSKKEKLVIAINRGEQEAHVKMPSDSGSLKPLLVTRGEIDAVKVQSGADGIEMTLPRSDRRRVRAVSERWRTDRSGSARVLERW